MAKKIVEDTQQVPMNPFLKAADISAKGRTMLLLTGWSRRAAPRVTQGIAFGEQIILEVQDEHETLYDFSVSVGSPNHKTLHKAFGPDEKFWRGSIAVERQQGSKAPFVAIVEAAKPQR